MSKEKEKGIEELYSYLIKNKDEISKEEYEELKKDFKNTLLKAYSEKSISKRFFEEYFQKIKELEEEGGIKKKRTEEKEIKYCPKCGAVNEKDSIFCAKCGYEFKKELKKEQPSSKKSWFLVIGFIAIVCAAGVFGEHFFRSEGETESSTYITSTQQPLSTTKSASYCFYDFELETISYVGDINARHDYKFCIATIKVINNSDIPIHTNPYNWVLESNGITYNHHYATYSDKINFQSVDINKGGTFTFQIVYEVPESMRYGTIRYIAYISPKMIRKDLF